MQWIRNFIDPDFLVWTGDTISHDPHRITTDDILWRL